MNFPLRRATALETVSVIVPDAAVEAYESALLTACGTVGLFLDEDSGLWTIEGVKDQGANEPELAGALALACLVSGFDATVLRHATPAEGWLARTYESFPEQLVGRRFAVRGTHLDGPGTSGRLLLTLDAGVAFGSGEHGSTRGCLRALEAVAWRRPRRATPAIRRVARSGWRCWCRAAPPAWPARWKWPDRSASSRPTCLRATALPPSSWPSSAACIPWA